MLLIWSGSFVDFSLKEGPASLSSEAAGLQPPDGIEAHCFALVVFTFLISSHSGWISMWNRDEKFHVGVDYVAQWQSMGTGSLISTFWREQKKVHFKVEFGIFLFSMKNLSWG